MEDHFPFANVIKVVKIQILLVAQELAKHVLNAIFVETALPNDVVNIVGKTIYPPWLKNLVFETKISQKTIKFMGFVPNVTISVLNAAKIPQNVAKFLLNLLILEHFAI